MIETLTAWIPSLLISSIAFGAFLYLAYKSRAQIDKLQRTMQQNAAQLVQNFLLRESRLTRHRLQTPAPADNATDPARWLAHMRRCWLEAELAALVDGGQHHSDYALLQKAAQPLLRLTQRTDAKTAKPWSNTESQQYLQKTRDAVSSQKKIIQEFKARKAAVTTPSTSANASTTGAHTSADNHAGFISVLGNVESNTSSLLQTIEKLERELALAQNKYDVMQRKLTDIETQRSNSGSSSNRVTVSRELSRNTEENTDLLNEMESAYTNSINEMKKMGDINRQQRHLILQMEKELSLLRKDTSEYQVSADVLDKLKLQLRDYENCTTILEMESETLRDQIQHLRRTIADSDQGDHENSSEAIQFAAPAVPQQKPSLSDAGILELIESISAAESLENAGTQLVSWLIKQDISSVIYIKGAQEQIWVSSEGRVDDHSKQLLKSMMPVAGQPITEVREGVMFIYSVCRVLLYGKGDFHERNSKTQLQLRDIFGTIDHIVQLFQERLALRHRAQQALAVQKKFQSLLVQHNYIDTEHMRTSANFRKEIDDYLLSMDTSEVQRRCVATMIEDFDSQLEILSKTSKLVATGLKVGIQDLAKMSDTPRNTQ